MIHAAHNLKPTEPPDVFAVYLLDAREDSGFFIAGPNKYEIRIPF